MKKIISYLLTCLKGLLLGFVCVATPGVSGGTIAVIIGIFTTIIDQGNNLLHNLFKKQWWLSVLFFVALAIGGVIGAYIGSKVVTFTFEKYPLAVTMLLIGFILGSLKMLYRNVSGAYKNWTNILLFVIVFALSLVYTFCLSSSNSNPLEDMNVWKYLALVGMGIIGIATMIVPGISGNIFLMAFGYYYPLNNVLSNITTIPFKESLPILAPFVLGCLVGAILIIKVLKFLLDRFNVKTNVAIFAFVVASPIIMIKLCLLDNVNFVYSTKELLIGIGLLLIGFAISFIVGILSDRKEKSKAGD